MAKTDYIGKLGQVLRRRPMRAADLLAELAISQATFSRLWATVKDGMALGAGRARQYGLRRPVPGVDAPIPIFRVSAQAQVEPVGYLHPLYDSFYALTPPEGTGYRIFQGMPYFLRDLRPQGFLGRMEPGKHRELDLPADILRWTDEQVLKYISRRSEQAAGDLVFGNESYARYLADLPKMSATVTRQSTRAERYPDMARHAMQGEPPGSSAGGEQPKFTAIVARDDDAQTIEHVIVKFSPQVDTISGRRWGDLLICEHLALETLADYGIASANTTIMEAGGRVFLEVVRFDRVGLHGRLPMVTFSALDGDLGMLDQSWTAVAQELARLGQLPAADVQTVEILDLFGALIGNTDKHHGNIALAWTLEERHTLLAAYDTLPMLYRPNAHGEIVPRHWTPDLGGRLALQHLPRCCQMAQDFWRRVLADDRISQDFKNTVAGPHLHTLQQVCLTAPPPPASA